MTISEAINYINARTWSQWKLGLSRTRELLALLGDPQKHLRFVHVAGSNGKGSTCAMVERILREAGYVTGLFPSPYIEDFRERIQVSGEYITEEALCRITEKVAAFADAMEEHPTHFELITAIGMVYFKEKNCDIVVLEVGLGGIFDSTNIIDAPEIAVITNIGLEHTEYLGNTLGEIAWNKCGIIKTGADVVCYENEPEVMEVVRRTCAEKGCALHMAQFRRLEVMEISLDGQVFAWKPADRTGDSRQPAQQTGENSAEDFSSMQAEKRYPAEPDSAQQSDEKPAAELSAMYSLQPGEKGGAGDICGTYRLALTGEYQLHNAATVLTVIEVLRERGYAIPEEAVARGLERVQWPARFEILSREPLFILDGGHNPQCAEALTQSLLAFGLEKCVFLIGVLADKDYRRILDIVAPFAAGFVCLTPDSPRALPAEKLAGELRGRGFDAIACPDAGTGILRAVRMAAGQGALKTSSVETETGMGTLPVVCFGSLYMAGEVRPAFRRLQVRLRKDAQRRKAMDSRRRLTDEQREEKSRVICEKIARLPEIRKAGTIFSYAAAWDEVNLDVLHRKLTGEGKIICYPVSRRDGRMDVFLPKNPDAWRTGPYGIREPREEESAGIDPAQIDAVLVPCVAFDRSGGRCGHGAGFYDRFLPGLRPGIPKILVAFAEQELPEIVTEETDVRMDIVVTD